MDRTPPLRALSRPHKLQPALNVEKMARTKIISESHEEAVRALAKARADGVEGAELERLVAVEARTRADAAGFDSGADLPSTLPQSLRVFVRYPRLGDPQCTWHGKMPCIFHRHDSSTPLAHVPYNYYGLEMPFADPAQQDPAQVHVAMRVLYSNPHLSMLVFQRHGDPVYTRTWHANVNVNMPRYRNNLPLRDIETAISTRLGRKRRRVLRPTPRLASRIVQYVSVPIEHKAKLDYLRIPLVPGPPPTTHCLVYMGDLQTLRDFKVPHTLTQPIPSRPTEDPETVAILDQLANELFGERFSDVVTEPDDEPRDEEVCESCEQ